MGFAKTSLLDMDHNKKFQFQTQNETLWDATPKGRALSPTTTTSVNLRLQHAATRDSYFIPSSRNKKLLSTKATNFAQSNFSNFFKMFDDQDLGLFASFLGIFIFVLVAAYHQVMADPKYEGN